MIKLVLFHAMLCWVDQQFAYEVHEIDQRPMDLTLTPTGVAWVVKVSLCYILLQLLQLS